MSIKKCVNGSFVNDFYKEYGTDTDTITSLPKTIIGDGTALSAWSMKGNMSQSGTPTPSNPIYPTECGDKTANLFDISKVASGDLSVSGTTITKGTSAYNIDLFSGLSGASTAMSTNSMVLEAGTYTLAYDLVTGNVNLFLICVCPYTSATREPVDKYFDGYNGKSFTISEKSYVSLRVQQNTAVEVKDVALYSGSTAPPSYEPYGMYKIPILSNSTTYPIYLSEPIRKIGDSVDTVPSTGTATRYIYKHELTGQETWTRTSVGKMYSSNALNGTPNYLHTLSVVTMACSHYKADINYGNTQHLSLNEISLYGTVGSLPIKEIYIYPDGYATAEDYATYLQQQYANGTPVTIWFIMETPTTETFTAPSIPTSGTAQSFDVDTTLKPSEVSLTYHGWHEHTDTKYTSG